MHRLDTDDLARRYQAGESMKKLANDHGVTAKVIKHRLVTAGIALRTTSQQSRIRFGTGPVDPADVERRYVLGESEKAIAVSLGVSRCLIRGVLRARGAPIRGPRAACCLHMSRLSPEARAKLTEAAHAAVRGVPQTMERLLNRAKGRERLYPHRGSAEMKLAAMLEERGVHVTPQKAVGPYNVDLALAESAVAVEIFGGHWHAFGRHAERYRERIDYLINDGWLPIIVWVTSVFPLRREAAHYVVAWHDARCYHKSPVRQEHVIRGDGYGGPVFGRDTDGRPVVPSTKESAYALC